MLRFRCWRRGGDRRGVILLVVLAMLTLFALVGLAFVLYADAQATAARVAREAQTAQRADANPQLLLALFLNQLLYDVDDTTGVYSALRGQSLARSLYGYNDGADNDLPFNGMGRLHYPSPFAILPPVGTPPLARDDYYLINYTYFPNAEPIPPLPPLLRDPERLGTRLNLTAPRGLYTGGCNAPYTYPDLNNLFLAAVKADGTVLLPSYHRPWLFGSDAPTTNPNWTNAVGKYLLLRPRPQEMGPGFPLPETGGDVKNLVASPGGNDSYWLDLGAPVFMAPDGTKYKPLFAPLIVDLDNRINLNVHGNARGLAGTHLSNQGFGPWEVNPRWLSAALSLNLTNPPDPAQLARLNLEWTSLLLGKASPPLTGRYGGQPWNGQFGSPGVSPLDSAPVQPLTHFYNSFDFDGCTEGPGGVASLPILLPGFGAPSLSSFPLYPLGYGGASPLERLAHPLLDNVAVPRGNHRVFPISDMEALLRPGDMGSSALTAQVLPLCPENFGLPLSINPAQAQAALRRRRLVTTLSADLDRPGVSPWIWNRAAQPYTLGPGAMQPSGSAVLWPSLALRLFPAPLNGEFSNDWRSTLAVLDRVDLNRPLPFYPPPTAAGGRILDPASFLIAQSARVQLARDIYDRLRMVTGATDPTLAFISGAATQFNALRWLAQLAVNIVDYIDRDDYMTPFDWFTEPSGNKQWVLGTELPRLVVNEVYSEIVNNPADPGLARLGNPRADDEAEPRATLPYQVHFWVELHNPLTVDATLTDGGAARLQMPAAGGAPAYAVHRLIVARSPNLGMRNAERVLGNPDPGTTLLVVSNYQPAPNPVPQPIENVALDLVVPDGISYTGVSGGNAGFYVLGPAVDFPGAGPRPQATLRVFDQILNGARNAMTYDQPLTAPFAARHTLLLQRLACPFLPPNPDPAGVLNPLLPFNPYVTIDYLNNVPVNNGVLVNALGPNGLLTPVAQRHSTGRNQPYAAHVTQQRAQQPQPPLANQPQHTLLRHNAVEAVGPASAATPGQTLQVPFDWLVHLDRPLIGPTELPHVSAYKPHELTQQFCIATDKFQHTADWWSSSLRIYRAFEFLETHSLAAGIPSSPGGRIPGKVNINTIWDPEVLLALCDPQLPNNFHSADIYMPLSLIPGPGLDYYNDLKSIYWKLLEKRSPNLLSGGDPGPDDRPLLGSAAGAVLAGSSQYPQGSGIERTLLRSYDGSGERRLFQPSDLAAGTHPYQRDQLLTKIFSHLTTRSNVFAVWLTVGFLEVVDDSVRPVKLGVEVGRTEGRQIRHRMFALVDRSELAIARMNADNAVLAPGLATITVAATGGIAANGRPWSIPVGCLLAVDVDGQEESVRVLAVTPTTFTAAFTRPHRSGFLIRRRGNPGPQPNLALPDQAAVVPYFNIIE